MRRIVQVEGKKKIPKKSATTALVPVELVEKKILLIRGQKVILDSDLAMLYDVETGALVRQVKRI